MFRRVQLGCCLNRNNPCMDVFGGGENYLRDEIKKNLYKYDFRDDDAAQRRVPTLLYWQAIKKTELSFSFSSRQK